MNQRSNVLVVVALGLMLGVSGCAHTETLVPEAAAPPGSATGATPAAPHVLFSQLKGRMVSVKMIDRRADTANTSLLLERTQKLAQGVLREGGAQIGDSDDQLIIMVDDFGERDQGSMTSQCAKFTGRFPKA